MSILNGKTTKKINVNATLNCIAHVWSKGSPAQNCGRVSYHGHGGCSPKNHHLLWGSLQNPRWAEDSPIVFSSPHTQTRYCNCNKVKVSYCTACNMKAHISLHNIRLLGGEKKENKERCNCWKDPCQVQGNCGTRDLVYDADVLELNSNGGTVDVKRYIGQTMRTERKSWPEEMCRFQ